MTDAHPYTAADLRRYLRKYVSNRAVAEEAIAMFDQIEAGWLARIAELEEIQRNQREEIARLNDEATDREQQADAVAVRATLRAERAEAEAQRLRAEMDAGTAEPSAALALCEEMFLRAHEWSGPHASSHYRSDIRERIDKLHDRAAPPAAAEPDGLAEVRDAMRPLNNEQALLTLYRENKRLRAEPEDAPPTAAEPDASLAEIRKMLEGYRDSASFAPVGWVSAHDFAEVAIGLLDQAERRP